MSESHERRGFLTQLVMRIYHLVLFLVCLFTKSKGEKERVRVCFFFFFFFFFFGGGAVVIEIVIVIAIFLELNDHLMRPQTYLCFTIFLCVCLCPRLCIDPKGRLVFENPCIFSCFTTVLCIFVCPQDCVYALRESWSWLDTLTRCMRTHVENTAGYHQVGQGQSC